MDKPFRISPEFIAEQNRPRLGDMETDLRHLGERLARRGVDVMALVDRAAAFRVALPSWGVGTGGTRFARFPGPGEPRSVFEKIDDCATVQALVRSTPTVSLHIPWDRPSDADELRGYARDLGMGFDAVNSNTFQDQPGQARSYKHGSLTHTDPAVRAQAVEHNLECIALGRRLGSKALTLWIGDGANHPGQHDFRDALDRYLDSTRAICAALPDDWYLFLEHKLYEPAFYATVLADWGTSYMCALELGPRARCLVDLGHHAPGTNVEMIVSRLAHAGKLGGLHFNDSKYGDDDLDTGSVNPFQLFLVMCELVGAAARDAGFRPACMLDQSHNVTDPIESLATSAEQLRRAHVQALLVDRAALREHQRENDAIAALATLRQAYQTDVEPVLAAARVRAGGAVDPIAAYRASGYRSRKGSERPQGHGKRAGIV